MDEAIQEKSKRTILYMQKNNGYPENLLQRFSPEISKSKFEKPQFSNSFSNSDNQQPDLTLRLSLNGFYCEKSKEKSLTRSSSIPGILTQAIGSTGRSEMESPHPGSFLSLSRSCSLPSETEQQGLIMLKEWQTMRRMEAKKRLLEQRNGRVVAEEEKLYGSEVGPAAELAAWAAASTVKSPALCRAIGKITSIQECLSRNGTIEGQGGVPSSICLSSSHSSPKRKDSEPMATSGGSSPKGFENPGKKAKISNDMMQNNGMMDVLKMMPSVTTTGNGPNGKKIEGFLYRYLKGQVSIVCVCHGSFLSPAEFVKHAGGGDVANPMKHIKVCTGSFSF